MKLAAVSSLLSLCLFLPTTTYVTATTTTSAEDEGPALYHPRSARRVSSGRIGECQGDCDSSSYNDCESHLACWFRDPHGSSRRGKGKGSANSFRNLNFPRDEVPGCPAVTPPNEYIDYCVDPDKFPTNRLWYVGDNHKPRSVFPLKRCWGDCDTDHDCADDLICLQRNSHSPTSVPGCSGEAFVGVDYCIVAPPTPRPTPHPTPHPTRRPVLQQLAFKGHCNHYDNVDGRTRGCKHFPLDKCEGDCDSNRDCQGHLICFFRDDHPNADVPGCRGHPVDDHTDYCIDPDDV